MYLPKRSKSQPDGIHTNHRSMLTSVSLCAWAALLLGSCSLLPETTTPSPNKPEVVFTSAAETAIARITETAIQPATTPPPSPSLLPATSTPTPQPAISTPEPTDPSFAGDDQAAFVADMTIPDGTAFDPATDFTKTWRVMNVGTSTWTADYALVFVGGDRMGGVDSVPIPGVVAPDASVDISVELTAPNTAGLQRGFWKLRNASGDLFGVGSNFDQSLYVEINVTTSDDKPTGATSTAPPSGSAIIRGITLSVSNASYSGACPHTFNFTANVNMRKASRVTLQLEAGASNPGYQFFLPAPTSFDFGVGVFQVTYSLELSDSVDGWARVRTTAPDFVLSNQTAFSLECK